jgi:tetratricopeptide (TPR) repeat protein
MSLKKICFFVCILFSVTVLAFAGNSKRDKNQDKAQEDFMKDIKIYFSRGIGSYYMGNIDDAIASFDMVIEKAPRMAHAYNNRGIFYIEKGDMKKALEDFDHAGEFISEDNDVFIRALTGNILFAEGNYEKAKEAFDYMIKIQPDNDTVYYMRGKCFMKLNDLQNAQIDFEKALSLRPEYVFAKQALEEVIKSKGTV